LTIGAKLLFETFSQATMGMSSIATNPDRSRECRQAVIGTPLRCERWSPGAWTTPGDRARLGGGDQTEAAHLVSLSRG